jgi:hypothetical protein
MQFHPHVYTSVARQGQAYHAPVPYAAVEAFENMDPFAVLFKLMVLRLAIGDEERI